MLPHGSLLGSRIRRRCCPGPAPANALEPRPPWGPEGRHDLEPTDMRPSGVGVSIQHTLYGRCVLAAAWLISRLSCLPKCPLARPNLRPLRLRFAPGSIGNLQRTSRRSRWSVGLLVLTFWLGDGWGQRVRRQPQQRTEYLVEEHGSRAAGQPGLHGIPPSSNPHAATTLAGNVLDPNLRR